MDAALSEDDVVDPGVGAGSPVVKLAILLLVMLVAEVRVFVGVGAMNADCELSHLATTCGFDGNISSRPTPESQQPGDGG